MMLQFNTCTVSHCLLCSVFYHNFCYCLLHLSFLFYLLLHQYTTASGLLSLIFALRCLWIKTIREHNNNNMMIIHVTCHVQCQHDCRSTTFDQLRSAYYQDQIQISRCRLYNIMYTYVYMHTHLVVVHIVMNVKFNYYGEGLARQQIMEGKQLQLYIQWLQANTYRYIYSCILRCRSMARVHTKLLIGLISCASLLGLAFLVMRSKTVFKNAMWVPGSQLQLYKFTLKTGTIIINIYYASYNNYHSIILR